VGLPHQLQTINVHENGWASPTRKEYFKEPAKNKLSFSLIQLQVIFACFEVSKILEIVHYYCGF